VRCRHCSHVWRDDADILAQVSGALGSASRAWTAQASDNQSPEHASTLAHLVGESAAATRPLAGEWVGRKLGRYEIKSVLGQGAMGHVYEAYDADLTRSVAIKVMPRKIEPGQETIGLKLFLQEARIAAKLSHPGIVTIYEIGHEQGYYYFAMERVAGKTLASIVDETGPLPAAQTCYIVAQAAKALAAGHAAGVVHRDVKPGNIMIDTKGHVKITDFGLADVTGVEGIAELSERPMGTPAWISPEVARGEKATPASDIYSLGLTLHYALTRNRLVTGSTKSQMLRSQQNAPSIRREQLPAGWPERLRDIVVQCLQADPQNRYQSADQLAEDLVLALRPAHDDATLALGSAASSPTAMKSVPPALGWIVLGLLAIVAVLLVVWWYLLRSRAV
jgi:serine/threonine-protein kinase